MNKIIATEAMDSGALSRAEKAVHPLGNYWKALVPVFVGVALLFLSIPEGLTPNAWYYFALFWRSLSR